MSRLADYSKFDRLTEDSDDDDQGQNNNDNNKAQKDAQDAADRATNTMAPPSAPPKQSEKETKAGTIKRDKVSGRFRFEFNGHTVYEFEQSLDDTTLYVLPPPYITKGNQIKCVISANHFKLGLVGHGNGQQQWFLDEATFGTVDIDESTWTLEDHDENGRKIIVVVLTKANRGTIWEAALKGNPGIIAPATMDAFSMEQVKKDLMLERFNEENPGFDFSGADFNGNIPNAREFMGGVKY